RARAQLLGLAAEYGQLAEMRLPETGPGSLLLVGVKVGQAATGAYKAGGGPRVGDLQCRNNEGGEYLKASGNAEGACCRNEIPGSAPAALGTRRQFRAFGGPSGAVGKHAARDGG